MEKRQLHINLPLSLLLTSSNPDQLWNFAVTYRWTLNTNSSHKKKFPRIIVLDNPLQTFQPYVINIMELETYDSVLV